MNVVKPGAIASSAVDNKARLIRIPSPRSMRWLNKETTSPATAIPMVLEFTAMPIAASVT